MKANKIYIQEGAILRTEKTYDNDLCYIRKDYLLEWATRKQCDSDTIVQDDFWQDVIDKLNEL